MRRSLVFAYPGDIMTKTGGYAYDRKILSELRAAGWAINMLPLGPGFPFPRERDLQSAQALVAALPDNTLVLADGLAFGVLHEVAERERERLRIVALVHHPLALETGLDPADRMRFEVSERLALKYTRHVFVTSSMTGKTLENAYGVLPSQITVVVPGTETADRARGDGGVAHIVSVGSLTPRKGHDVLLRALARIIDLPWKATIVGSDRMDAATVRLLANLSKELDLTDRVTFAGEVEDVGAILQSGDIFALASRYEGYGMVFAEAQTHGLPIVACRAGAVPDVVPQSAGILVAPDNVMAFAEGLRELLQNEALRAEMAEASFCAGQLLPSWPQSASIMSKRLEEIG